MPAHGRRRAATGLRVFAASRPAPLTEVRLYVPLPGAGHATTAAVLAEMLFAGRSRLRDRLDAIGGHLFAVAGADSLVVSGNALAAHTRELFTLLAGALREKVRSRPELHLARARIADGFRLARSRPELVVHQALSTVRYAGHPYGQPPPEPTVVDAVTEHDVIELWESLRPADATLCVVASAPVEQTLDLAAETFAEWRGSARPAPEEVPVPPPRPGPVTLVHRDSADRVLLRWGLDVVGPAHPELPAVELTHTALGGSYSCRLVETLRQRHGWAYTPSTSLLHQRRASLLVVSADVPTEAAEAVLDLVRDELRGLAENPVRGEELERARGKTLGAHALSLRSAAHVADVMLTLAEHDLELDAVERRVRKLHAVRESDMESVARRLFTPERATEVVLGDAVLLYAKLSAFYPVVHRSME